MILFRCFAGAVTLVAVGVDPASAQDPAREAPPAAFARAIQCRAIADAQARLACYDREVAALEQAERTSEIRVVDRQQVRRTRRTLFGLTLPDINIFGGGDDGESVNEISSTIRSFSQDGSGKYTFVLEDGARWRQLDTRELNEPKAGQPIRIRRGAMGSFLANVNQQVAIRVRRVN
ncbi:MAG TPA: hypothetical protein VEZ41_07220 [Allosphingosinicella sp.]|jgi:hypothetical protein|nr:hypothetical protein [Allosphingosinicella sp.]